MSGTIAFSLIRKPELLDIVDKAWEEDVLSPDGASLARGTSLAVCILPPCVSSEKTAPLAAICRAAAAGRRAAAVG